jgi:hypothetical protein
MWRGSGGDLGFAWLAICRAFPGVWEMYVGWGLSMPIFFLIKKTWPGPNELALLLMDILSGGDDDSI